MRHRHGTLLSSVLATAAWSWTLLLVICLPLIWSCGGGAPQAEVRGKVEVAGKPLTRGLVNLIPDNGAPPVGGPVSADGSFAFLAPLGSYRVTVVAEPQLPAGWKEGDPLPPLKLDVPEKYSSPLTSGISTSISSTDPVRLELKLEAN